MVDAETWFGKWNVEQLPDRTTLVSFFMVCSACGALEGPKSFAFLPKHEDLLEILNKLGWKILTQTTTLPNGDTQLKQQKVICLKCCSAT